MAIRMHMPPLTSVRGQTLLTDNKPYLYRQSPIESQMLEDMIVGGTVAWNQLVNGAGTVTVTNNHKYVSHIGSTWSIAISNGSAISVGASDLVTDLTLMFSPTIADYVYSLEQSTAGSGIAWLKSFGFFTEDYYPYDAGSLLSVKTSAHETVKNGVTHTYPLSDIELRGIPKLTDGQLYYDGDTYKSDGTVTRKYRYVEYDGSSDENWKFENSALAGANFYITPPVPGVRGSINVIRSNFVATRGDNAYGLQKDTCNISNTGNLNFSCGTTLGVTSVAAWRTYLASRPLQVVYLLATPTSETTDSFTNPQTAGSTEEYIDTRTVPIPVGHVTEYFNMVQKESISMHMPTVQPIKMHMPTA